MTPNKSDNDAASGTEKNPDSLPEETPFQRFENFVRKVISVPKSEIEERERAYQESKNGREQTATGPPQSSIPK